MSLIVDTSTSQSPAKILGVGPSNWERILEVIAQVALHVLIPFAAAYLSYLLLPESMVAIGVPFITMCTVFVVAFLSIGQQIFPFARIQLPPTAPRGMENSGMNCWMNSLAQTLRCDEGLMDWFSSFPDEWERIQRLPHLAPSFLRYFPKREEMELFNHPEIPPLYLETYHSRLAAANLDIANARSYYRDFCEDFQGTDVEFLAHIRGAEFIQNLYDQDRQKVETYFEIIKEAPEAHRYFNFFAEIAPPQREARKLAMQEFKLFFKAYEEAQNGHLANVNFSSQRLRVALSGLNPLIDANANVQLDPMEALTTLGDHLTPRDLKVRLRKETVYEQGQNPLMVGGQVSMRVEEGALVCLPLPIIGSNPTLQDLLNLEMDKKNQNPEALIRKLAVDGTENEYLVDRERMQFMEAPPALWLQIKRMANTKHSSWECLQRILPCWFSKRTSNGLEKLDTSITVQQDLTVPHAEEVAFRLDGFITHHGPSLQSGHYTSCQRVEVEPEAKPGQYVWFEMDDRTVRELSLSQAMDRASQAYALHYSRE